MLDLLTNCENELLRNELFGDDALLPRLDDTLPLEDLGAFSTFDCLPSPPLESLPTSPLSTNLPSTQLYGGQKQLVTPQTGVTQPVFGRAATPVVNLQSVQPLGQPAPKQNNAVSPGCVCSK